MADRARYAIIPTNGRACLKDCLMAIAPQVDVTIVVYTVDQVDGEIQPVQGYLLRDTAEPVNISRWWNRGLETVRGHQLGRSALTHPSDLHDIAILNDDAIVPEGWFDAVSAGMREHGAAAACSGSTVGTQFLIEPGPIPGVSNPLTGFAFMLAGEKGLRANEDIHWYFSDNYIDWESRKLGGTLMMSGWPVQHLHPNAQMGHDLIARVAVDAQNFVDLYGMRPW